MNLIGKRTRRAIGKVIRDETGSEMVEFAVSAILFFTIIFGIADMCRAMYAWNFTSFAAQQGARYAMVRGSTWPSSCSTSAPPNFTLSFKCKAASADVQNYVKNMGFINSSNIVVTTTWPGTTPDCSSSCTTCSTTNSQGCYVKVKVVYTFSFMTPFPKRASLSFQGTSEKVIQQ